MQKVIDGKREKLEPKKSAEYDLEEGGEKRDDSFGDYHRDLRPEMAELLCLYACAGAHHGKPEADNIR